MSVFDANWKERRRAVSNPVKNILCLVEDVLRVHLSVTCNLLSSFFVSHLSNSEMSLVSDHKLCHMPVSHSNVTSVTSVKPTVSEAYTAWNA